MKVLLVIDHAPDYREQFFRELSSYCDLTVVAQPCALDGLMPPAERVGYNYLELPVYGKRSFRWQSGLIGLFRKGDWDVKCVDLNVRQLSRVVPFIFVSKFRKNWIWRGQIFGRRRSHTLFYIKKFLLHRAVACLVYNEPSARRLEQEFGVRAVSFNNTEVRKDEFRQPKINNERGPLRLLYVGRNQKRKKLDRLISLVDRRSDVLLRLVGPGMDELSIPNHLVASSRIELFGKTNGDALNHHFDWADLVVNPGHAGLLVMNAARHGKTIAVDSRSEHAPEAWLAKESGQPFLDFSKEYEVDRFIDGVMADKMVLEEWSYQIQKLAKEKYTIENMARIHLAVFQEIASRC